MERISALLVHSLTGVPLAAGLDGEGLLLKRMLARRPDHPYSRAVRLELASILDARGARDAATALRDEAARAWTTLLGEPPAPARGHAGVPWPPHVIAHVAPNAPVREGFTPAPGGVLAVRAGVVAEAAARIDAAAPPPAPPYAFDIAGDARTRGCTIVWWELVPR